MILIVTPTSTGAPAIWWVLIEILASTRPESVCMHSLTVCGNSILTSSRSRSSIACHSLTHWTLQTGLCSGIWCFQINFSRASKQASECLLGWLVDRVQCVRNHLTCIVGSNSFVVAIIEERI